MIIIEPFAGLANRMRAIDSAMMIARTTNKPIKILWEMNPMLNCSFDKLFRATPGILIETVDKNSKKNSFIQKIVSWATGKDFVKGIASYPTKYIGRSKILELKREHYDFLQLAKYKTVHLKSQDRFYDTGEYYLGLKPAESIMQKVSSITSTFGENIVGIHIRRTDNINSIKFSPIKEFVKYIETEIVREASTRFFLATDSLDEENYLKSLFPDKIITYSGKALGRDNEIAIQDAYVDMLCLSKTTKICGSYWSSFSEVAAEIGNIAIEKIITK